MSTASPGDRSEVSQRITTDHIERFADLTGDENPLHLDPEYAAEGLFDGPVAHGMLVAGLISSALASLPGDVVYLSQDLSFEAPVHPDQTVTATAEVLEDLGDDRYRVETTARVEDDVVVSGEATVLSLAHEG
ncbi:MaoC family dehydratase [Natronosalvus halobius]|uniref:MaoC family dehydratase n=1 Tax=Natronosalvus halobius TaxID=2953746 RepID=UPI00209F059D|nr:MaoC family dehydratase [Natronosalvus halobius]USZ72048.1 MaoC family dehydratase [Natronosalvus halobius]